MSVSMFTGHTQFCPVLLTSRRGLNWGLHSPSSRGTWGDAGQAPELLVGHLSVAKVQFLDVTSP